MKTVAAMGEVLIDFIPVQKGCSLKEVVSFERVPGGAPANVVKAVARLGGSARMISQVGMDAFGDVILDDLISSGVDVSGVSRTDQANTGLAFVSLDSTGNRDFCFFRNPSADMLLSPTQISPAYLKGCGALHFCSVDLSGWAMRDAHRSAIKRARSEGAIISFDPNVRLPLWKTAEDCQRAIRQFLPEADVVKLSDDEIEFVMGCTDERVAAEKLLTQHTKLVIITRGAGGSAAYTKSVHAECEPVKVSNVVDTTGAGDSFIGSLLWQFMRDDMTPQKLESLTEDQLIEYLRFSSLYASLTVQKKGAVMATLE
ncbi:MAG: carbohydrate kinase, partial [Faecalibacterium sp.]